MTSFYILAPILAVIGIVYLCYVLPIVIKEYQLLSKKSSLIVVPPDVYFNFVSKFDESLSSANIGEPHKASLQTSWTDRCQVVRAVSIRWPNRIYFFVDSKWNEDVCQSKLTEM